MAKISIDIENVKNALSSIGYVISDCIERDNNGTNWQIKFSNSGACVTIYDTNEKKNSVVNGKCDESERGALKEIVDLIKCKELEISPMNQDIVDLINSGKESDYYDFKQQWKTDNSGDLVHDILCLANNLRNCDSYLIVGVADDCEVVGVNEWKKSNEIFDYLREVEFAYRRPEVELLRVYYKYFKIDVLSIKGTRDVPYYLNKQYRQVGTQIYTRVGDTNTPKNKSASYHDVEKLWQMHFGVNEKES